MAKGLKGWLRCCWGGIRQLSGDDAYERYLVRHEQCRHGGNLLSRREYFRLREHEKWHGVRRCC